MNGKEFNSILNKEQTCWKTKRVRRRERKKRRENIRNKKRQRDRKH
jgi:hypothetical protein